MLCCAILLVGIPLVSCKRNKDSQGQEQLKTAVTQAQRLAEEERKLLAQRGSLQQESARLRDKRADIARRKVQLQGDDTQAKQKLEAEERKVQSREAEVTAAVQIVSEKLETISDKQGTLFSQVKSEQSKGWLFATREKSMAAREKELSEREKALARREADLARREEAFAQRQAKGCPQVQPSVIQRITVPVRSSEKNYTRDDVESTYRSARSLMQKKGILTADLPPGVDQLITKIRHAVAKKDLVQAKFAADQLWASVKGIKIDRNFISAKMSRLSVTLRRRKIQGAKKNKIAPLLQRATASYGDGRMAAANRTLNQIYGLMR